MRKVLLFLLVVFAGHLNCCAIDHADNILSLVKMPPESITRDKVEAMFGKPVRVEEGRKGVRWYYVQGSTELTINWNAQSGSMQKFAFTNKTTIPGTFDNSIESKLRSGALDINNAVKLLGMPRDMIMKEATQVLHYSYHNNVLRLFFRNRTLVDYTLVESHGRL